MRPFVPCRPIAIPVLPALSGRAGRRAHPRRHAGVLVVPFAFSPADLSQLPAIPHRVYQTIVIEKSGQVWTLPNQLGDPARAGTGFYEVSQGQTVTFDAHVVRPANGIAGNVVFHGDPSLKSGNIVVQAYAALPFAPPPPLGAARPVRVQLIRAQSVTRTSDGFTVPWRIDGCRPATTSCRRSTTWTQLLRAEPPADADQRRPGGAVIDTSTLRPAVIPVTGLVTGQDVLLAQQISLDPPAFEADASATIAGRSGGAGPLRRDRQGAFRSRSPRAARDHRVHRGAGQDAGGATVDADGDGLPDVWPRVFLVRLDSGRFDRADAGATIPTILRRRSRK